MSADGGRRRRRWLLGVAAALVVLVATAVVIRYTVFRDRARVVAVDDALDRFREEVSSTADPTVAPTTLTPVTSSPVTSTQPDDTQPDDTQPDDSGPPALPEPGVYRYLTTGEESVDILGGARHEYPAETTITVLPDGCGVLLRWDALVERREEWRLCATVAGVELQPLGFKYQEFFSQPKPEDIVCDTTALLVPADPELRPVTELDCLLGDDPWFPVWEVLGLEEQEVEGAPVPVARVRMTVDDPESEHWEVTSIDWWLAPSGLPVRAEAAKRSRSPSPIGGVVYEETFTLSLVSLTPLR